MENRQFPYIAELPDYIAIFYLDNYINSREVASILDITPQN